MWWVCQHVRSRHAETESSEQMGGLLLRMVTSLSTFSVGAADERLLAASLVGVSVRMYPLASCSR